MLNRFVNLALSPTFFISENLLEIKHRIGLLPAWNVLASPISKNEFVVRLSRKKFLN